MNRTIQRALISAAVLAVTGCSSFREHAFEPAAGKPGNSLEESSQKFKEGLTAVGDGVGKLKDIDPAAIKQLLAEHKELEIKLRDLQTQLTSYGPKAGAVNITSTNRAYFEITGYKGTLRIDAWVDDKENWFISNALLQGVPAKLNIAYDIAVNAVEDAAVSTWRQVTGKPMDGHLWVCDRQNAQGHDVFTLQRAGCAFSARMRTARSEVDAAYEKRVSSAFVAFLLSPFTLPSGNLKGPQAIDQRFKLASGEHVVYLRVTPEQADTDNKWAIEYRTYVTSTNGSQLQIGAGRLDSNTPWTPGAPLEPIAASRFYAVLAN